MKKVALALVAVAAIAGLGLSTVKPAEAQAVYYQNVCAWSITKGCAYRRATGKPLHTNGWARRNGYSGYVR
jgi:hypothetical protein